MQASDRLSQAYKNAKIEYFDDASRYVFLSDAHRGDSSLADEFSHNENIFLYALDYYYRNGFTYAELGDGDELWEHAKFKHIRLAHSEVYQSLKKFHDDDRLIMLYGNHNMILKNKQYVRNNLYQYLDEYYDEKRDLFPNIIVYESLVMIHKETGQEILAVHGHQGDTMNDQGWIYSMFMLRYFWRFMHVVGFQNPASPAKNANKRHKIERMYNKWIESHKMMLICGHTHRAKYPRTGEQPYFNTGCCIRATGITGIEILEGKIQLVEWQVKSDRFGNLKVARNVVRGPDPIEKFNIECVPYCELTDSGDIVPIDSEKSDNSE